MRGKMEWIAGGILFGKEGNLKEKREREPTTNSVCVSCLGERDEAILLFLVAAGISAH